MQPNRFKLQVVNLEDRITPAVSPMDVFNAIDHANTTRDTLAAVIKLAPDLVNVYTAAFLRTLLPTLTAESVNSAAVLAEYQNNLADEAVSNPEAAQLIGRVALERYKAEINAVYALSSTIAYSGTPATNVATPIPPGNPIPPTPIPLPPAPPPVVIDTTTNAGLSETIPDITTADFVTQTSGLKIANVIEGQGTAVKDGDSVMVFYTGWLKDTGVQFDSNRTSATPATFTTGGVIAGFKEGLIGMKPGGIRRVVIPSSLGYGAAGSPPSIPANADLVFEIKVVLVPAASS